MPEFEYEPMTHAEKIQWMLEERGWGAIPVRPEESPLPAGAGYTHTVGLESSIGRPELVVVGLQPAQARGLLDLIVAQFQAGIELPTDAPFVGLLDGELPACLLTLDPEQVGGLFPTLGDVYGEQPWRVCQFVWPDPSGALPWDDAFPDQLRATQPLLTA